MRNNELAVEMMGATRIAIRVAVSELVLVIVLARRIKQRPLAEVVGLAALRSCSMLPFQHEVVIGSLRSLVLRSVPAPCGHGPGGEWPVSRDAADGQHSRHAKHNAHDRRLLSRHQRRGQP